MEIPSITKNETLGLEAVTTFNEKPYFFLFSDIDSKDKEELLKVLKFYQKRHLSCYYYETTKGYHVVSPILMTFRTWLFRIRALRELVPQYSFGAIRISKRPFESSIAYYQDWNDRKQKESSSFHALISEIFYVMKAVKQVKPKKTKLNYIWYDQLNFKSLKTVDSENTGGICFPTCRKIRLQERDLLCKGKQTFDSLYTIPVTFEECKEAQL